MHIPSTVDLPASYRYFVHYLGWNVRWDKWVPEFDLLVDDEETRALVKLVKERSNLLKGRKGGKKEENTAVEGVTESKKRSAPDYQTSVDEAYLKRQKFLANASLVSTAPVAGAADRAVTSGIAPLTLTLQLPFVLKKLLVDDWETITGGAGGAGKRHIVLPVMSSVSVCVILDQFLVSKKGKFHDAWEELVRTLVIYFDKSCALLLLYPPERDAHLEATQPAGGGEGTAASAVYGIEHLLRLFVKLPSLVAATTLTQGEAKSLLGKVGEIARWLAKEEQATYVESNRYAANVDPSAAGGEAAN